MREISEAERVLASTLAKTIIRRRHELGKTQEQVALEAEMDRNHYQLMEHARSDRKSNYPSNPRLSTLIKLSKVLDCSVHDLLDEALAEYERVERLTAERTKR
ncbi:MAG: helix-turn-helix transcriptional regulator [Actinomycetaceae bacterium]|nr:helix-turn-helix transcriptional regulator [Actinomycetaceae bacterium]